MTNDNRTTEVKSVQKEPGRGQRTFTFKATQLVWLVFGILETLILLRILLKLLAANPNNQVAAFIYSITDVFLAPFAGLTGTPAAGGMVLELSSLLAVVVYALIAWVIERVVWLIFYRPRGPVEEVTQTTSNEHRS
jgi:YggT family protein